MDTINKYLTESKIKGNENDIKKIIQSKKSSIYEIDDNKVVVTVSPGSVILKYPSSMMEFTYKLSQVSDSLNYDYTEIGLGKKDVMKFIIDKD